MPKKTDSKFHRLAVAAVARLQAAGFTTYLAGGCVRDILLQKRPKDFDIATNALPSDVERLFPGAETSGKSFAVTRAPVDGLFFEVATFRMDHSYTDGRRPDRISASDPETDAQRRDFTVNAIFLDPIANEYHDFTGGRADLAARIIRCVGSPDRRFAEDHLRMMRAVRFTGSLGFTLDEATAESIRRNAPSIRRISAERIHDELARTLVESKRPGDSLVLMDELGLLKEILPEVAAMKGQAQPPEFHPEGDVFTHTVAMLNMMVRPTAQLAFSVLFHDIGKPATATQADRIRFNGHAAEGARMATEIMQRLKFSIADTEAIATSVRNHMRFMDVTRMRKSTLRKLVGAPTFPLELELHRLDCASSHGDLTNWNFVRDFMKQLADEPALPQPWITGRDIIALGIPESPTVGRLRTLAYDAQLEGQFKTREELLDWLKREHGRPQAGTRP